MSRSFGAISILALIAALAVVGTVGAASPIKGTLKYCSDPTFPPMEYKTTAGKAVGFDVDLANAIAKNWKIKAKFVETGFTGLLPGLAAKRCTVVISGIFITPDRLKQFPAVAYMKTHRALVVPMGFGDTGAQPDVRRDPVLLDAVVEVGTDLGLRGIRPGPVALDLKRERVERRLDVARAAGICVVEPRAASRRCRVTSNVFFL